MPRIAVIDDEPLICQLVDAYFLGGGIKVDCANTAWRGAELLLRRSSIWR